MIQPRITALLLPGYSPDLHWLARALGSGRVVLDDLHPFSRKSRVHRAKIRTPDGYQWLTIPVVREDRNKPVNQVRIDDRRPWIKHHLQAIEFNYRNSLYFDFYEPEIRSDFDFIAESGLLIHVVSHLMSRQWTYLQLPDYPEWASHLFHHHYDVYQSIGHEPDSALSTIWQEPDKRNYQKPHDRVVHPEFSHPEYRQHFRGFVPGCSMLDLLFEYGPDSWQILDLLKHAIRSG